MVEGQTCPLAFLPLTSPGQLCPRFQTWLWYRPDRRSVSGKLPQLSTPVWWPRSVPSSGNSKENFHLELVELSFYKAKNQRRLSNCWLSWKNLKFTRIIRSRLCRAETPTWRIIYIHSIVTHMLNGCRHICFSSLKLAHHQFARNRFQAGVRAMTQTSTITKEGSNKENSPNRTSLNWQILAWPPPGLWAADILDKGRSRNFCLKFDKC